MSEPCRLVQQFVIKVLIRERLKLVRDLREVSHHSHFRACVPDVIALEGERHFVSMTMKVATLPVMLRQEVSGIEGKRLLYSPGRSDHN
jgi:hypothetical protein